MIPTQFEQVAHLQPLDRLQTFGASYVSADEAIQLLQSKSKRIDPYRTALCSVVAQVHERPTEQIKRSVDLFPHFKHLQHLNVEVFSAMLLNRNNRIMDIVEVSRGGVSGTVVDVRVIARHALTHSSGIASAVALCHNHPSGAVEPSNEDLAITRKIKAGLNMLDIQVVDHIIIGGNDYYSFADSGML